MISDWSNPNVIAAVVSLLIAAAAYLKANTGDKKIGDVKQIITSDVVSLKRDKANALQKVADLTGTPDAQEAATRALDNYAAHAVAIASLRDVTPTDVSDYNFPPPPTPPGPKN